MTTTITNEIEALVSYLQAGGKLSCARVSSAKVSGRAKNYPYLYSAAYDLAWSGRLRRPCYRCAGAIAGRARRSMRLVEAECDAHSRYTMYALVPSTADLSRFAHIWLSS